MNALRVPEFIQQHAPAKPLADGVRDALLYAIDHSRNLYFPSGVYDLGDNYFPFPHSIDGDVRDYRGIHIFGDGDSTVISTTSGPKTGRDVFQLNKTANLVVRDLAITAHLGSTRSTSGSNGVSITNGGANIRFENVVCFDLPYIDKGSYGDGGKAFTIQTGQYIPGVSVKNEHIRFVNCRARNCLYGFGVDAQFEHMYPGHSHDIFVDLSAENCYRGVSLSGTEPSIKMSTASTGITINANTHNCQQDFTAMRMWGFRFSGRSSQSVPKKALVKKIRSDKTRIALRIAGCRRSSVRFTCDVLPKDADDLFLFESAKCGQNGVHECQFNDVSINSAVDQAAPYLDATNHLIFNGQDAG